MKQIMKERDKMKVTEDGIIDPIKWYQPESAEECKGTDCRMCVYYSYIPSSASCPFEAWMKNHPVEELTDLDCLEKTLEHVNQLSNITQLLEYKPLIELDTTLSLLLNLQTKMNKLGEILQEQPLTTCSIKNDCNYSTVEFLGRKKK